MGLYQGTTPVALISSDFGSMSLGNEFIVPAQYVPMPTPIGEWRYTEDVNGTKFLQEYLGNRSNIKVPFNHTMIQKYSDGTTNAPFYNRSYSTIENLDLMQTPFQDNDATRAFSNTTNIKSISNINQNITNIRFAFYNCKDLKKLNLTIPNSVYDSISYLCDGCTNLTDVKLNIEPGYFYYSTQGIFNNCSNLTNLSLSVPNYRRGLDFGYNLTNLKNVELLNLNTIDGSYGSTRLSAYNSIENVKVTSNAQYNESSNKFAVYFDKCSAKNVIFDVPNFKNMSYFFRNMPNLENISLNCPNVTSMWYAFENCQKLTSIPEIPNSVINLDYAFSNTSINNINMNIIGDNKIIRGTFVYCNNLTDVNMNIIGNNINISDTFTLCNNLTDVNMNIIGNNIAFDRMFSRDNIVNLEITCDDNKIFKQFSIGQDCNVTNFKFNSNLSEPLWKDHQLFIDICNSVTNLIFNCPYFESIVNGFNCYMALKNVEINCSNLTNMYRSFYNCPKLTDITLNSNSVINMAQTFSECYNLVNAPVIPNSVTNMRSTFAYCYNLVNAPEIPNSVTDMGSTFGYCNNLSGDIIIHSSNVFNAIGCFSGTLQKNVYIPFKQTNVIEDMYAWYSRDASIYNYPSCLYTKTESPLANTEGQVFYANGTPYTNSNIISTSANSYINFGDWRYNYTRNIQNDIINGANSVTYNSFNQYYGSGQNGVTLYDINELNN